EAGDRDIGLADGVGRGGRRANLVVGRERFGTRRGPIPDGEGRKSAGDADGHRAPDRAKAEEGGTRGHRTGRRRRSSTFSFTLYPASSMASRSRADVTVGPWSTTARPMDTSAPVLPATPSSPVATART